MLPAYAAAWPKRGTTGPLWDGSSSVRAPSERQPYSSCGNIILDRRSPNLSTNADHLPLCCSFITVGVALLILIVVALYCPMAAARLEGWLMAAMP